MTAKKETFEGLLRSFQYRYDLRTVFDDFLTITLCTFSQNLATGKSHDEDLYMQTIAKYTPDEVRECFPQLLACLIHEMDEQFNSDKGNDVLGSFYEENLYRKGAAQYFTPWSICSLMAKMNTTNIDLKAVDFPLCILDPSCGSGRMLMASAKENGREHEYYGIDIDHTCVKMAAVNMFFNGMFHSEIMCGDALDPDDFKVSYKVSFLPFGVFRIMEKEQSPLWRMHKNSFPVMKEKPDLVFEDAKMERKKVHQLKLL